MIDKPKRKRRPQPQRRPSVSGVRLPIVILCVVVTFLGGLGLGLLLMLRWEEPTEFTMTATQVAASNQTLVAQLTQTTQQPTITPTPTSHPPATITPTVSEEAACTWITSTRIDPNGLTPDVQQVLNDALLPAEISVMVHIAGEECLGPDELLGPNFVTRHTDYHLVVRVDDRFLNDNIENDTETREQLGLLIRRIFMALEDNFPPTQTEGDEPGFIFMTFINGDVIRYTRTTFDVLARSPYRDFARGTAVIGTAGELYR